MIILLLDEPGLFIYPDADAAARDVEAIDIESSLRPAYDDSGYKLNVEWIEPNRRTSLGPIKGVQNGRYRLVRSAVRDPLALADLLSAASYFDPPEYGPALRELASHLRNAR